MHWTKYDLAEIDLDWTEGPTHTIDMNGYEYDEAECQQDLFQ